MRVLFIALSSLLGDLGMTAVEVQFIVSLGACLILCHKNFMFITLLDILSTISERYECHIV